MGDNLALYLEQYKETLESKARKQRLVDLDNAIKQCRYTWTTIPKEQGPWLEVFQVIGSVSSQLLAQYLSVAKDFYYYLRLNKLITNEQIRFYPITAKQIYRSVMQERYFSSLEELLQKANYVSRRLVRLTEQGRKLNCLLMGLLWEGLDEKEIRALEVKDYGFKEEDRWLNLIQEDGSYQKLPITEPATAQMLDECYEESLSYGQEAPLLIFVGAGAANGVAVEMTSGAITMRVRRFIELINSVKNTKYTALTIKDSGGFHRTWKYFKEKDIPFYCNQPNSDILLRNCRKADNPKPCVRKNEFEKFIEYCRCIKGEEL